MRRRDFVSPSRRRGGLARWGTRTADSGAGGRVAQQRGGRWARTSGDRIPPGYERDRFRRWPERGDR